MCAGAADAGGLLVDVFLEQVDHTERLSIVICRMSFVICRTKVLNRI